MAVPRMIAPIGTDGRLGLNQEADTALRAQTCSAREQPFGRGTGSVANDPERTSLSKKWTLPGVPVMSKFVGLLIGDNTPRASFDKLAKCLGFETTGAVDNLMALWSKETTMKISSRRAATMAAFFVGAIRPMHKHLAMQKHSAASGHRALAARGRIGRGVMTIVFAICAGTMGPAHDARAELVSAVEFYHAEFGHFFLTTSPLEMGLLDTGVHKGWSRAMYEFKVDDAPGPGLVPACRFFSTAFAPKSSHFLTAFPEECAAVKASSNWVFEGEAFYVRLPDLAGTCAAGTMPIYRAYNGGQGGAPAHRLTPYLGEACVYFGQDCVKEGYGPEGVAFCAPASLELAQQRTQQMSGGTWEFSYPTDGPPQVVRMSFGGAVASHPAGLPPRYWPESPYYARAIGQAGFAGWDPVAGKIVVAFFGTMLQFDFDGVNATSGCAYLKEDLWDFYGDDGRGPCHPLTARRM
jgi:hypothetical protein